MDDKTVGRVADQVNLGKYQFAAIGVDEEGQEGRWVFHRPTLGELPQIAAKAELLKAVRGAEGAQVVEVKGVYHEIAYMIACLDAITDMRPNWAPKSFGELYDLDLLADLFRQYDEWVGNFRRRVPEDSGENS